MAILEKEVLVKYSSKTSKHYAQLGYSFPKTKDANGVLRIKRGTKILVRIEDLTEGSNVEVTKICDICGKRVPNQKYATVLLCRKEEIDKCLDCQTKEKGYNRGIADEYNCIANSNPEFAKLFWNVEDTFKYSCNSGKVVDFKCPDCGNKIHKKIIANVNRQGISCPACSDSIPYPEKFVFNMLCQLTIEFEYQALFDKWFDNKRIRYYDFFIPSLNCIIETHGKQHYVGGFERYGGTARDLKKEQENDLYKKNTALNNGINENEYIVIDSRNSNLEHMKNSITKSYLSNIFDLSKVNWLECHEYACKSIVEKVSEMWSEIKNITEISKFLKMDRATIRNYLRQGALLGWNEYNSDKQKKTKKAIVQLDLDGNYINEFKSQSEAGKQCGIRISNITGACGRNGTTGGFKWMYKEDYDKYIENQFKRII